MLLYVNGCSFAQLTDGKRYSDYIAESLNIKAVNAAQSASSNARILRTTQRDLIELKQQHKNIFALISLTTLLREDLWIPSVKEDLGILNNDGDFISYQFIKSIKNWWEIYQSTNDINNNLLPVGVSTYGKEWLRFYSSEAEITKLLSNLINFTAWLKVNSIQYCIFNGIDPLEQIDFNAPFIKSFKEEIDKDANIYQLFDFSFGNYCLDKKLVPFDYATFGDRGHPNSIGHKLFADFLIEKFLTNLSN